MFGYIRIAKPELKVKEYEMYKAVYCSLCRNIGKEYGFLTRFTLSYDFTFLALINMALTDKCTPIEKKRCVCNPFKKCNYCRDNEGLQMPSAAAVIMLYYKILDNIADEKGIKKLAFWFLKQIFKLSHNKAAKNYPEIEEIVSQYIKEQNILENENCNQLDAVADPTAKALSKILQLCSDNQTEKRILERMGYCLGRYIYILDAACDLEKDIETGSYNVLKNKTDVIDINNEFIKPQLYFCSNEAAKAFELLDVKRFKSIIGNIIYIGLEDTFKKELKL